MSSHILAPFRAAARFVKAWTAPATPVRVMATSDEQRAIQEANARLAAQSQQQPPLWQQFTPEEAISFQEWKRLLDSHYRR